MASVDLLLAGREGNGKSSTGNSILDKKVFRSQVTNLPWSDEVMKEKRDFEDKKITVVDGLSVRDNSIDGSNNTLATIGLPEKFLSFFDSHSFTAIIICLKYGVRFTSQEKSALNIIRSLFGEIVIKNHGILVLTHGDIFDIDVEDEETSFEKWCQEQTGEFQKIYEECGHRIVLFDNRTKENDKKIAQIKNLLSKVAEIQSRTSSYTMDTLKQAYNSQRKLLVLSKLPDLQKKTNDLLDFVTESLKKLEEGSYPPSIYLNELEKLKNEIDSYKAYLKEEDEETNSIKQLLIQIYITEASMSSKKEKNQRKLEYGVRINIGETPPPVSEEQTNKIKYFVYPLGALAILMGLGYWFFIY